MFVSLLARPFARSLVRLVIWATKSDWLVSELKEKQTSQATNLAAPTLSQIVELGKNLALSCLGRTKLQRQANRQSLANLLAVIFRQVDNQSVCLVGWLAGIDING